MKNAAERIAAAMLILAFFAGPVFACPVCFGDTDSKMAEGLNMGVWVLLGITGVVLTGFAALIFTIWARIYRFEKRGNASQIIALTYTAREN